MLQVDLNVALAITEIAKAGNDEQFRDDYEFLIETVAASFAESLRIAASDDLVAFLKTLLHRSKDSRAQLFQDLWVLHELKQQRSGYFVDIGAANGRELSNTYLLEKKYGWKGILVEPNPQFWPELEKFRNNQIECSCIFPAPSGKRLFRCTEDGHYSTLSEFANRDFHFEQYRSSGYHEIYADTLSAKALVEKYSLPSVIDYLTIDTEGSEFAILQDFPFGKCCPRLITVEHNYGQNRQTIHDLLASRGYVRKFTGLSRWDDWYVLDASVLRGRP